MHLVVLSWRDRENPDAGGAEVFLAEVTAGLVERGWRVTQLSAGFRGAAREQWSRGVRVVRRGGRLTVFAHALAWHVVGRFGRCDAVLDVQNGMPFLSPLVTRRPVVVLVHHVHREQWPILFGRWLGGLGWWIESRLAVRIYARHRYVAVSQHTRADLASLGVDPANVAVVHNGAGGRAVEAQEAPAPTICVLGRLVPHKRIECAIEALAKLRVELAGLTLEVVGAGDWEPALRAVAVERDVADAVRFHGRLDERTRDEILARSWVLAMPSLKEGWGLAVMEAAAQGTPAVAFAQAGGVTESVLDGVTGLLAADTEDFARQLRLLLTDHELRHRLGDAARSRTAEFTWDAAADALARVLQRAQGAANSPS